MLPPSRKELLGFSILFIAFLGFAFINKSTFDSGDSIQHYLMSRYSWKHSELFFNHWGKPFFTILSSPFSQFGFIGIQIFNILVSVLSGYFVYMSSKKLGYVTAYFPLVVLFTATDYFLCMYSGLTEPLFGLILILVFYLILEEKFLLATLIISFLPFVRSEGNIILILYTIYFISKKQYRFIPLLLSGTILISLLGYPVYKTISWVFTANPYTSELSNYGKGELLHYVKQLNFVTGIFYCILLIFGTIYFSITFLKRKNWKTSNSNRELLLLVFGSFFGYFVSHSIFWWQGWFHSYGMTRVLIAILPIGTIICIGPIDVVLKKYPNKYILPVMSIVMIGFLFSGNKSSFNLKKDFSMAPTQALAIEMNSWYKTNYSDMPVVIAAPHLAYIMGKDYFDPKQCTNLSTLKSKVQMDKLIIWDNWMAVMEVGVTDQYLDARKELILINTFGNGIDTLKIYIPREKISTKN